MTRRTRPTPIPVFVALCSILVMTAVPAAASWWTESAPTLARTQAVDELATMYRTFEVDAEGFRAGTSGAPMAYTGADGIVFELPTPDGTAARFRVVEDPILSAEMAARRPDARFYSGVGIDDPHASVRFGITDEGVHGRVRSVNGSWTLEWMPELGPELAVAWWDREAAPKRFGCGADDSFGTVEVDEDVLGDGLGRRLGGVVRTYRWAMTATGEFTTQAGGVSATEAIMMTLTNTMNVLYLNEFSVRFELVAMNVYADAATDPFPTGGTLNSTLLLQNDQALDAAIGSGSYDVGHIISVNPGGGAGGLAFVGGQCSNTIKGAGGTLLGSATAGAVYPIMIHEVGHQLGASHSFNSSEGGCNGNRSGNWAYEIGSGVTIMSYAGLCASENVQGDDIDVFNAGSQQQISSRILQTGSCGSVQTVDNDRPLVTLLPNVTVPRETAFELTAIVTDPDGDPMTYSWEHHELGPASPPVDPSDGPAFRNFAPSDSPTRSFPEYNSYRRGGTTPWEFLATVDRTMPFRVVIRDNNPVGGAVVQGSQTVVVSGAPFVVTGPSGGESFEGGTTIPVTWDVGGSQSTEVRILASDDNGVSWTEVLAATANDGAADVLLPCGPTTDGRIRIEGIDNPFFDLNTSAFTVTEESIPPVIGAPALFEVTTTDESGVLPDDPALANFEAQISVSDNCGEELQPTILYPAILPIGDSTVPITATDGAGNLGFTAATIRVTLDDATDAPTPGALRTGLVSIAPNPFNPRTTIEFALERAQDVTLEVFDVRGRRIGALAAGEHPAGRHEVVWNGTDADGRAVPSGVYFMRLVTEEGSFSERALLLK